MGAIQSHHHSRSSTRHHHHHQSHHHRRAFHPTYRSWQELQVDENGNYQFVYSPSPEELEEEVAYVYASCKYKTPPVGKKFMERLPTLKLEHDASHLLSLLKVPSSSSSSSPKTSSSSSPPPSPVKASSFSSFSSSSSITGATNDVATTSSGATTTTTSAGHCYCSSAADDECLICFAAYSRGCTLVTLPCGHSYHKDCIQEWFYRQCTCPYCRYEFPTDHPAYEKGRKERMARWPLPLEKVTHQQQQQQQDQEPIFLVDRLKRRQEELRHLQHRNTVLDQLSFSSLSSTSRSSSSDSSSSLSSSSSSSSSVNNNEHDAVNDETMIMPPPAAAPLALLGVAQ